MLKLKKIIRSSVCFLVLLAFAGTISLESIPVRAKNQRIEVSVLNIQDSIHLMAISEGNDSDETDDPYADLMGILSFNPSTIDFNKALLLFISQLFTKKTLSLPLYLNYRCLRL